MSEEKMAKLGEKGMKLLVGPRSLEEVKSIATIPGIDILDIKNTQEGSYGAADPRITANVVSFVSDKDLLVSATLGDLSFKPGTAALAALGAVQAGAQILKAGLFGVKSRDEGVEMMKAIKDVVRFAKPGVKVLAGGYAEYEELDNLSMKDLISVAVETGCFGIMIDTYYKDRGSVFDVLGIKEISEAVKEAHKNGLIFVLAGSVQPDHISYLGQVAPDVVAIRGGLCKDANRHNNVDPERVTSFVEALKNSREKCV
jgi:(5-formylfuran-3-yl)methyl phosphate synthase